MILLSVCHTKLAYGASSADKKVTEYEVGKRATRAAFEALYDASIPCIMTELGHFTRSGAMAPKQRLMRNVTLAVEIHCNANDNAAANYSETIYYPGNKVGKSAAEQIQKAVSTGFVAGPNHKTWLARGARADGGLFFLKTATPAVIVEGVFVSNVEQAQFLASDGGPEAYGLLVAEGLKSWFSLKL